MKFLIEKLYCFFREPERAQYHALKETIMVIVLVGSSLLNLLLILWMQIVPIKNHPTLTLMWFGAFVVHLVFSIILIGFDTSLHKKLEETFTMHCNAERAPYLPLLRILLIVACCILFVWSFKLI